MFFRFSLLLAVLLIGGSPSARALDFQLRSVVVEEDGFKREQAFFRNDEKSNVFVLLPAGWDRTADPGSLVLTSPGETDTMVRLEKSPVAADLPFKDKALDTYRRRVLAAVPQGATDVQIAQEHDEPLPIFHWKSHEFVVDYVFFGREFRRSVVFLDLNAQEQVMVTAVASKAGFERTRNAAFDLLRSWQVVPVQ